MSDISQFMTQTAIDKAQLQRGENGSRQAQALARRGASGEGKSLEEVAQQFESLFVKQMLDSMRSTLSKENRLVDTGMAGEYFQDMLYEEYSKIMAKRGTFGVAELIVEQLDPASGK